MTGYIAKKMIKRLQCNLCKSILTGQCTTAPYFHFLSRGNLTVPSTTMAEFTCSAFALLDYYDQFIAQQKNVAVRDVALCILHSSKNVFFFVSSTSK